MIAPDESFTSPVIVPSVWAEHGTHKKSQTKTAEACRDMAHESFLSWSQELCVNVPKRRGTDHAVKAVFLCPQIMIEA
jgi:hypothetical protein